MPRAGSLLDERSPAITAAVIAAQATATDGFRQRDVRFFIELFSNWLEPITGAHTLQVHNTQVQRLLNSLAKSRLAQRLGRSPPRFRLTPDGLIELLRRLVLRSDLTRLDEFLLVHHFLDAYGERLRAMALRGGSRLIALDLDQLSDPARLIVRERERIQRERARLAVRCAESRETSALARAAIAQGASLDSVIHEVEQRYPYELNSQKPLPELLRALPESWRREELVEHAERRADRFWEPLRALLAHYDTVLASLQPKSKRTKPGTA